MDDFVDLGILAMLNVMWEIGEMELEGLLKCEGLLDSFCIHCDLLSFLTHC